MSHFGVLSVDNEYELTVKEIYEAKSSFVSKKPPAVGQTLYCHHFILEDEDRVRYKCQVCETKDTQNYCNVGDTMTFKVKSFTMEIHTIEFTARDGRPVKQVAHIPGPDDKSEYISANPKVGDTARAIALQCSVLFFQNRQEVPETNNTVLAKADEFFDYLIQ